MIKQLVTAKSFPWDISRNIIGHGVAWLVMALLLGLISGCEGSDGTEVAKEITTQFYQALQQQDYHHALSLCSDKFFDRKPHDVWLEELNALQERLGPLQSYTLKHKQTSTVFSGRRFVFEARTRYAHGTGKEMVVLFLPISDDSIKINFYQVDPRPSSS